MFINCFATMLRRIKMINFNIRPHNLISHSGFMVIFRDVRESDKKSSDVDRAINLKVSSCSYANPPPSAHIGKIVP